MSCSRCGLATFALFPPRRIGRIGLHVHCRSTEFQAGWPPAAHRVGPERWPVEDFDALLGEGSDLWADEAEFARFLAELRRW
jgi:hypothetical protein